METLPQDIIDQIISYLVPRNRKPGASSDKDDGSFPPLAPLAGAISYRVQCAVERQTFKSIKISSQELQEFSQILTPRRRFLLTSLSFTAILPTYDAEAATRAESPAERAANDESYTEAISSLFHLLESWEIENPELVSYRFALTITHPQSPSDGSTSFSIAPQAGAPHRNKRSIRHGRYLHSYISLEKPASLPILHRVKKLEMPQPKAVVARRNLCPKVSMLFASKMPNLEQIEVSVDDDEKRFPEIRKQNRLEMAEVIHELSLPSLRIAIIEFSQRRYVDETVVPPILHDTAIPDPLSSAFYGLSLNLVRLEISGVFDLSLLRPLQGLSGTPWPRLQALDITLFPTTPSGDWYFTGNEDHPRARIYRPAHPKPRGHSELHLEEFSFADEEIYASLAPSNIFRNKIKNDTFVPFIKAFTNALSAMPKLFSAALDCQLEEDSTDEGWFTISYFAPCAGAKKLAPGKFCPNCYRGATRQLVTSMFDWTENEELAIELRKIQENIHDAPIEQKAMGPFLEEHSDLEDGSSDEEG